MEGIKMPRDIGEVSASLGLLDSLNWPHPDRVLAPASAVAAATEIDETSGRRTATPVRKLFVRTDLDEVTPPMARLFQAGGRGGAVALKLYLALLWRCSREPFETSKPHRAWATLLGLEDPDERGARRVAAALKTLVDADLVRVRRVPAEPNVVTLLDESGDGTPYSLPSTQYARAPEGAAGDAQRAHNLYFKVPSRLWREGDIQSLQGPGLVMLLVLLAEQGGEGQPIWFSTDLFPSRYRISHKSRAAGTKELRGRGLLVVEREGLPANPALQSVFDRRRFRNVYRLDGAARADNTVVV